MSRLAYSVRRIAHEDETTPSNSTTQTPTPPSDLQKLIDAAVAKALSASTAKAKEAVTAAKTANDPSADPLEREAAQQRLAQLEAELTTKEEQYKSEQEKWKKKYETDTAKLASEASKWRTQFETNMIRSALYEAAAENDPVPVVGAEQIYTIFAPRTKVVEKMNERNQPTGQFITLTTVEVKQEDGTYKTSDMPTREAIKYIKESGRYYNLFNNKNGVNVAPPTGTSGEARTMAEFLAQRQAQRAKKNQIG